MYTYTIGSFIVHIENLRAILHKAEAYAKERNYTDEQMLSLHFAVDQFPLRKQVQLVSDYAKKSASVLFGVENPSYPDTEVTFAELDARLLKTLEFIKSFKEEAMLSREALASTMIPLPWFPGKGLTALYHAEHYVVPQFYFHYTTAYAILRNYGVVLGKGDYMGSVDIRDLA